MIRKIRNQNRKYVLLFVKVFAVQNQSFVQ